MPQAQGGPDFPPLLQDKVQIVGEMPEEGGEMNHTFNKEGEDAAS